MHFNQHFSKKDIEAAIRVALTNPNNTININGERSKQIYSVLYSKPIGMLYFGKMVKSEHNFRQWEKILEFDISRPMKKQRTPSIWVENMVEYICENCEDEAV